jgi:diaminohydroxyphosphoribosylaminopyrimidine deaminase/5-amino-6-(5-phosphoribosylamino)uracil reductase
VQQLRHTSDAILTGIGTVLADNPALSDRTGLPRRRPLLRVILDADLRLPIDSSIVDSAAKDVLVICHPFAPIDREERLQEHGVEVERVNGEACRPGLIQTLETLHDRKINSVLIEAGPNLIANFVLWDLVDKLVLYTAPITLGPNALPFDTEVPSPLSLESKLTHITRTTFRHGNAEDTRLTGYLHNPWSAIEVPSI